MNSECRSNYEELLPLVRKPSQYIGEEVNSIKKDLKKVQASIALVFPDMYEIGMAHLGLKILYHIINKREEFAAERVFSPDLDYEELLRKKCLPLASLENKAPLNKFDIIGFTIPYEMSYSNILNILDLGHIPLLSKDRGSEHPLIIGGGSCAYNPEPLVDFIDCFIVGDGEEIIIEVLDAYSAAKKKKETRKDLFRRLVEIDGVYIPSMFKVEYFEGGHIKQITPEDNRYKKVEKRVLLDLNQADYPDAQVLPFTKLTHDRVSVEIDRGCTQACRFCQAGFVYRPVRERSIEKILELLEKSINRTGYSDISLLSLSSGDYSKINSLLPALERKFSKSHIALSLPSLRPGTINKNVIDCMKLGGKAGFTMTVESGSQRLRDILNKKISEDEILTAVEDIAQAGWETIKIYFMIGLPTETYNDIEKIYLISKEIFSRAKRRNPKFKRLNISISFFVPKSHTPFQWLSLEKLADMEKKLAFLKSKFRSRSKYKIKWQSPKLSFMEAVFARGDRRLGKVLLNAFQLGCKFDGWSERFNYETWMAAFEKAQVDPNYYTQGSVNKDEIFPWDIIDIGVKKDYLFEEYLHSKKQLIESDCRTGKCLLCGLEKICSDVKQIEKRKIEQPALLNKISTVKNETEKDESVFKYRVQFTKTNLAKFLSHFETSSLLNRALRRSKIQVDYSKGYHPRPRISFDFALPVGMESKEEFFDMFLNKEMQPDDIRNRLINEMPLNMEIGSVLEIPLNSKSLSVINNKIQFKIYIDVMREIQLSDLPLHEQRLAKFMSGDRISLYTDKEGVTQEKLLNEWFDSFKIQSATKNGLVLKLVVKINHGSFISPYKVISTLYPELKNNRGNFRMVKEAAYYAI